VLAALTMTHREPILAVAESADFGPAYDGEDFVTLTFRVPKSTGAVPGLWELTPVRLGKYTTDYTVPTAEELSEPAPELDALRKASRAVGEQAPRTERTSDEGGLGKFTVHEWPDDPAEGV
jgi:hypothetical protein